ncbi:MAG: hypothetical protein ACK5GJ_07760 [Planctomycetota bacterium]
MILDPNIPTDSFFEALPKRSCVCVGFCSDPSNHWDPISDAKRDFLFRIATQWSLRTERGCCVITGQRNFQSPSHLADCESKAVRWDWLEYSNKPLESSSKVLAREVATLGRLRSENGLILMELGPIGLSTAQAASKLCDALALLVESNQSETTAGLRGHRNILGTLKSYQRAECRWLGYWRVQAQCLED